VYHSSCYIDVLSSRLGWFRVLCFDTVHLNAADRYCSDTSLQVSTVLLQMGVRALQARMLRGHVHHVPFGSCCSAGRAGTLLVCHKAHLALHD
jgi:hypothetical protein